jgi:hypothetical protein
MKGKHFDASFLPIEISLKNEDNLDIENEVHDNTSFTDNNWPSLSIKDNDEKIDKPKKVMDFNKIAKQNSHQIINKTDESLDVSSDFYENDEEYWKKDTYINDIAKFTIKTENEYLLFKSYLDLLDENYYLRDDIYKYKEQINNIKNENKREKFIIKNNKVYNEILENIKYINNRVTDQFIDTNYSDYVLF